jgi:hypothetical protein
VSSHPRISSCWRGARTSRTRSSQVVPILERAYAGYVAAGNNERAAAVAVQLAHEYGSIRLQKAVGQRLALARRAPARRRARGIAHGYLALERGLDAVKANDYEAARELGGRPSGSAASTATWGSSCAAGSVAAVALIHLGEVDEGACS